MVLSFSAITGEKPNQTWSIDFGADQLLEGARFRALTVVDVYTRECRDRSHGLSRPTDNSKFASRGTSHARKNLDKKSYLDGHFANMFQALLDYCACLYYIA